jgi:hypothetical protein
MAFTDAEVETVREIVDLPSSSLSELAAKLAVLNTAGENATRADIAQWSKIRYGGTRVQGGIKGTDYDIERDRTILANKVRRRLNMELLPQTLGSNDIGIVSLNIGWISGGECADEEFGR